MLLAWNDGTSYAVAFPELRFLCPCAACVDEHSGIRILRREQVRPDIRPKGVRLVGRYAAAIEWSDGHMTGVYPFDLLREISLRLGTRC